MPRVWDAIVVGAGPAGCAAAYDLAAAGRSVLLVDGKTFPRPKACAGGLTLKAVKALRYSIDPVVRERVSRMRLQGRASTGQTKPITLKSRSPICVMTVRAELDAYCLEKTIAAGARFQTISPIRQVTSIDYGVCLATGEQEFAARFLVGADGVNGQIRRLCSGGSWFSQGFALEVQAPAPRQPVDLTFDFSVIANGYGWIFPKRDHLNVGLYVQSAEGGLTRAELLDYVRQQTGADAVEHVTGQYLGLGAGEFRSENIRPDLRDRVFLTGDAGGFVDALTGEGIYGALHSGQAAAAAILSESGERGAAVANFEDNLRNYRQTLRFSTRAARAFYANPDRGFRLLRLPWVRPTVIKTYTHGLNVRSLPMRIALARA